MDGFVQKCGGYPKMDVSIMKMCKKPSNLLGFLIIFGQKNRKKQLNDIECLPKFLEMKINIHKPHIFPNHFPRFPQVLPVAAPRHRDGRGPRGWEPLHRAGELGLVQVVVREAHVGGLWWLWLERK